MNKNILSNYGTHMSIKNGLLNVLSSLKNSNINTCQIFTKSPQSFKNITLLDSITKQTIEDFINSNNFKLFIHGQYILNLCRNDLTYTTKSIIDDLNYIKNSIGVVIHMGKDTQNIGKEVAFNNMKNNILKVLSYIEEDNKFLILETCVKTKNDICNFYTIEGLANLYNSLNKHKNIKFCIDTCHIFASGYDISTIKGFNDYINLFDKLIGIENVVLFHLNDSKTKLNSGIDRHENLGQGFIFKDNLETLKYIIKYCNNKDINVITETDLELDKEYLFLKNLFSD